ncbi:MAG TPA: saccharopine dehydrogenase NADP-binding domain-containing protein [Solirubrobacteraceae bacterium]|jgi:short subunit dehydrogenase-like uncharacterized protein|nr:saccharopine dehydrogenase NADP-binding domain-containing protein [Solirubrobacteraceae bacterium]
MAGPTGRAVLFGPTGFSGRLVADALVRRGIHPVLAGRDAKRIRTVCDDLGVPLQIETADAADPRSLAALLEPGDLVVSTVGPFVKVGEPAVQAAVEAGANYIDITGEPAFERLVFERYDEPARRSGSTLVPAFGYDCVPGNLAGALALREAGPEAARLAVGYYITGPAGPRALGGGTIASIVAAMFEPAFAWREGRIVDERSCRHHRRFEVNGKGRAAVSIGATEHFALPRLHAGLVDVEVYVGWWGAGSRAVQLLSVVTAATGRVPGTVGFVRDAAARLFGSRGPDGLARARTRSYFVAEAYDSAGRQLAAVHLDGPSPYSLNANIAAWGAERALAGELQGPGVVGPVDGFGLDALLAGCQQIGVRRVG